jgi:hypothetical protein
VSACMCACVCVPLAVTSLNLTTMSSMLPYTFFFMPDARVAIHPPSVENSEESG